MKQRLRMKTSFFMLLLVQLKVYTIEHLELKVKFSHEKSK